MILTHIVGLAYTMTAQINNNAGKEINVACNPYCLITNPVPNNENKKEIKLVVYK
jgi:hypothetical protein